MKKSMYLLLICCCLLSISAAEIITLTPANLQLEPYTVFSFDLVVSSFDGTSAVGFESILGVDLPGLVFNETARLVSEMVEDDPDYWLYGVADGASYGCPEGSNEFGFADFQYESNLQALAAGDIMARYSFIWDGTPGDYTFTLNLDPAFSFYVDDLFNEHAIAFTPGTFTGGDNWFTVPIPEPTTLILLSLGCVVFFRERRRL